jgi:TolB-like protein
MTVSDRARMMEKRHFGEFVFDAARAELRGPGGAVVLLRPKTRTLLAYLLSHPGRVATREEILDAVWPGVTVGHESVDQAVAELRRALGADGARLIRTVPRLGYIFDPPAPHPDAGLTGGKRRGPPVLVVLPFANLSRDARWDRLCDGMTEDMITDFARHPDLRVVARTSSFAWRDRPADIRAIGRALNADYLLEGSIQAGAGRVRATAQLIEAASGAHVWADRYDREEEGLFAIQSEVVARVVGAVARPLGKPRPGGARAARAWRAGQLDAYDLYLRGYAAEARLDREGTLEGIALLEQAVAADPAMSRAWTVLGFALANAAANGWTEDPAALRARQRAAILRAVELDPEDGLALEELGAMLARAGDVAGARAAFERAAVAGANHADTLALLGKYTAEVLGQPERARRMMEHAFALNPYAPAWYYLGATRVAYFAGRFDEAAELAGSAPPLRLPLLFRALSLAQAGRVEEMQAALADHRARFGPEGAGGALAGLPPLCPAARALLQDGLGKAGLEPGRMPGCRRPAETGAQGGHRA